ncbi:MAG: arabinogalactan endo-1,4-beta-galactosidase [Bacteroidota bacterium]|nr:arabinogalactan endo-1,4-beta-galactosidase [Bacteroidota bacterium]
MRSFYLLLFFIGLTSFSCNKKPGIKPTTPVPVIDSFFAKGADISWVTQMESEGIKFYNSAGTQQDLFQILKDKGINSIRLRVWVNPANGWCNMQDVLAKALRAKNAGMKILMDFHYSDSWADPGQQTKPAAWANENITQLISSVSEHTLSVLNFLKQNNITVDWVQVGNETNDGMLWPEGRASTGMGNFVALINSGYDAVKSVFPSAKVIVHISNGFDNTLFRWIFDGLKTNNGKWDVIGMSLYPSAGNWPQLDSECLANMDDMMSRYNKDVMICEVGMNSKDSVACKSFISDIIAKTRMANNSKGLGGFYWEPECYNNWNNYSLGAFNSSGQPSTALDGFK